ncbi:hypothetical protein PBAC_27590 [Pedobacter glucosidilyticus]|nr:hypothetical protein [Pedobacter glucosidilyticus]KHJ37055.1 hypothetical protein PBAC_27590 [Pedobacter glucosidilyticus]
MKKVLTFLIIILIIFNQKSYAQNPISLKEVRVYPKEFVISLIQKMKAKTNNNLSKEFLNLKINAEAIKNNSDTVILINQIGNFQLKALHNRNYKFIDLNGESFYNNTFFSTNDFSSLLRYGSFYGRLNKLFELDSYKFLNDFNSYKYDVYVKENYYLISFSSDTYTGDFSLDTLTHNLLHLNYNLIKPLREKTQGTKIGTPKYIIEKANILESIDEAYMTFKQNSKGKITLNTLESRVLFDEFEIFKFHQNKENKLKYTGRFKFESFIRMKAVTPFMK